MGKGRLGFCYGLKARARPGQGEGSGQVNLPKACSFSADTQLSDSESYDGDSESTSSSESESADNRATDDRHEDDPTRHFSEAFSLPLYEGANVSMLEAYLLIYMFGTTFHLSGKAFDMLLLLL